MAPTPQASVSPRSTVSGELPADCSKDLEGDDDEKGGKRSTCSCDLLRDQIKQYAARAIEAEKIAEEQADQTFEWMEHANKHELELASLTEELRKQKEEEVRMANKQEEVFEKYRKALETSIETGRRANEHLDEVNKLRRELEQATKDIDLERLKLTREQEALAEATNIISGLMGKPDFKDKVEHKKPLTPNENMALRWRYPALEKEKIQLEKDIEEKKIAMGRLEFERDQLRLDLNRARSAPGSELSAEMTQKMAELEKANAQLRDELAQAALKAEKESTESKLLLNKLKMDNEDLTERLKERQERPRHNSHGDKDYRVPSTSNQGRRSLSKEEMQQMMNKMEEANAEVLREMERLNKRQKEQLEESIRQIEKKDAENDDLLDRNKKLADRLARHRRDTPPARDASREESRKDHSRHSRGEERREDRGRREQGSSDLREAVRRLEAEVKEEKRNAELLEADRNDLRAALKRARVEKTEQEEKEKELKVDIDLKGSKILHLECALEDLRVRFAKEAERTKGFSELEKKIDDLTIEVEELRNSLTKSEKERRQLEGEVDEQRKINAVLVTTKSGELMEELSAARKRIKELEDELQQGCISAKRARIEELKAKIEGAEKPKEPSSPCGFVLQAAAPAAPNTAPVPPYWKPAFAHMGSKIMNKNFKN